MYAGIWQANACTPATTSSAPTRSPRSQARHRKAKTLPARRAEGQSVEHEYERKGALCYLAAWDVRRAKIFDRCAPKDGIVLFDALVEQFMSQHPYRNANVSS